MQAPRLTQPLIEGQWKLGERLGQRESAEGALLVFAVLAGSSKGELRTGLPRSHVKSIILKSTMVA